MTLDKSVNTNNLFQIHITLTQYPILSDQILAVMCERLVQDGFITYSEFEDHVREAAVLSQKREGLQNPFVQEAQHIWEKRLSRTRTSMIESSFARHYSLSVFDEIVNKILQDKYDRPPNSNMWHNLQQATVETIFTQAQEIERIVGKDRQLYESQLMGAKVALIKKIITDELAYIDIAKNIFSISDLIEINQHKIGRGKVGGKAAGVILADRILRESPDYEIRNSIAEMESFFFGTEEFYAFLSINNLLNWFDQKYSDHEKLVNDYAQIVEAFKAGEFSHEIVDNLKNTIKNIAGRPFIVRSSSLLEDRFDKSFTGMYDSYIIPNQSSPEAALESLLDAIRMIYASAFNPNAIAYLKRTGLLDYSDRMGILIQVIPGNTYGNYYFADIGGIGASLTPCSWKKGLENHTGGLLRLCAGMGTRISRRQPSECAIIIDLDSPNEVHTTFLEDENDISQTMIDVINIKENLFCSADIQDVINEDYPSFQWMAQCEQNGMLLPVIHGLDNDHSVINFGELVKRTNFTRLMRDIGQTLEKACKKPIFYEFSVTIDMTIPAEPVFGIHILKCRPACLMNLPVKIDHPEPKSDSAILFTTDLFVMDGVIENIDYVVFVDPEQYRKLTSAEQIRFAEVIELINDKMSSERFVFAAGHQWGTTAGRGGIPVNYMNNCNALAIIELSGWIPSQISSPMIGTQLFHHYMESGIYCIITNADHADQIDRSFFYTSENVTSVLVRDIPQEFTNCISIRQTKGWRGAQSLTIDMNREKGLAKAFFI